MAYSELIKDFSRIRDYMREFFVYGFRSRDEFDAKSVRSYDNEKRRVESWLGDFMSFRQDANGKAVFISVDSRRIPRNPLYKAWKASGFTKNDISLHFLLLDILPGRELSVPEILERIDADYMPLFFNADHVDESTLRKKLKEYEGLGLILAKKRGRQNTYCLPANDVDPVSWQDAVAFFSEENPLGVVGSYISDKYNSLPDYFSFKHRYLLFALDSGIVLDLLTAINGHKKAELNITGVKNGRQRRVTTLPLKIFISVQGGRQYLAGYNLRNRKISFYRIDQIKTVKMLEAIEGYETYREYLMDDRQHLWGVATGQGKIEHVEMILRIDPKDSHIARRLEREKRCGFVEQLNDKEWRFYADVYDAWELLPWLRTFTGRIQSLTCSNKSVERRFWSDFSELSALYGGDGHAIQ